MKMFKYDVVILIIDNIPQSYRRFINLNYYISTIKHQDGKFRTISRLALLVVKEKVPGQAMSLWTVQSSLEATLWFVTLSYMAYLEHDFLVWRQVGNEWNPVDIWVLSDSAVTFCKADIHKKLNTLSVCKIVLLVYSKIIWGEVCGYGPASCVCREGWVVVECWHFCVWDLNEASKRPNQSKVLKTVAKFPIY